MRQSKKRLVRRELRKWRGNKKKYKIALEKYERTCKEKSTERC